MLSVLNLGQLICTTNWVNVSVIWVCFMELSIMLAFVVFVHICWFWVTWGQELDKVRQTKVERPRERDRKRERVSALQKKKKKVVF